MLRSLRNDRLCLPLSRGIIKTRALYEAKRLGISIFKASDGWLRRRRWRYNILNSVRFHGEAGDVDLVEADTKFEVLKSDLAANGYKALKWTRQVYSTEQCPIDMYYWEVVIKDKSEEARNVKTESQ